MWIFKMAALYTQLLVQKVISAVLRVLFKLFKVGPIPIHEIWEGEDGNAIFHFPGDEPHADEHSSIKYSLLEQAIDKHSWWAPKVVMMGKKASVNLRQLNGIPANKSLRLMHPDGNPQHFMELDPDDEYEIFKDVNGNAIIKLVGGYWKEGLKTDFPYEIVECVAHLLPKARVLGEYEGEKI